MQIPFTRGVPSYDMLPIEPLRQAVAHALIEEPEIALSYVTGGHVGLRTWIGSHYAVGSDQVVCANGSLEAFMFVSAVLLERAGTKRVIVEAPTYDRSILILQRLGAEIVGVSVDSDGLDIGALEAELAAGLPAFIYVIPNFQNPSGATLTRDRRERLVALSKAHGIPLVEDDPYGLLRWQGESYPTLFELAGGDNVVTLSSFTKTVAPGLRVGYAVASPELATAISLYATNTYISPSILPQAGLAAYVDAGEFEPGVERAKQALHERCDAMVAAVREFFPKTARFTVPQGGYFLWIDLGDGVDTTKLLARATEAGVPFVKGTDFYAGPGGETALRLAFSAVAPAQIREGIERLAAVIDAE